MSAWIVSKSHIDYLVHGARVYGNGHEMPIKADSATEFGRELLRECVASVAYRYDNCPDDGLPGYHIRPDQYIYSDAELPIDEVTYYKQLRCYGYQSCEHPEWDSSPACEFVETMCDIVAARLGVEQDEVRNLPTWDNAPWGIDEE